MSNQQKQERSETEQNSAVRAVEASHDPESSLEEARNAAEGKAKNAAGSSASSTAEEHIPSNSDPEATDLPSAR
jgi:hypothetical protein